MKRRKIGTISNLLAFLAVIAAGVGGELTQPARASCVVPMAITELADRAGQVLVGHVTGVHSYWTSTPRTIETEITLDQVDYLKGKPGALTAGTFTLRVPGGTVGDTTLQLSSAPTFHVGQTWLLFLQPTYKTYPVVGLSQGAFQLVSQGDGTSHVLTASGASVVGLSQAGYVRLASPRVLPLDRLRSEQGGVRIARTLTPTISQPIGWTSFRAMLEPILATSVDHHLVGPAGQPNPVTLTPCLVVRSSNEVARTSVVPSANPVGRSAASKPAVPTKARPRVTRSGRRITGDEKVVPRRRVVRPGLRKVPK